MPFPSSLTASALLEIRETAESGRGVYASQWIPKGTLLLETAEIAAKVIYREYRKEVCTQCFRYDRGRDWKVRHSVAGVVFCSQQCHDDWVKQSGNNESTVATALEALEALGKRGKQVDEWEDLCETARPTKEEIETAWKQAEETATRIRSARCSERPHKSDCRALTQALAAPPLRDILSYLMSGTLNAVLEPNLWNDVFELADDHTPYPSPEALQFYITSYHHILACCPTSLVPGVQSDIVRTLARKSAHNVFNIWSQDPTAETGEETSAPGSAAGGSECLGYGLWPAASYFNHSCAPNVRKRRTGNMWQFWADTDVEAGQELCITYLGGDEKDMSREERLAKLKLHWGFPCGCIRCSGTE